MPAYSYQKVGVGGETRGGPSTGKSEPSGRMCFGEALRAIQSVKSGEEGTTIRTVRGSGRHMRL